MRGFFLRIAAASVVLSWVACGSSAGVEHGDASGATSADGGDSQEDGAISSSPAPGEAGLDAPSGSSPSSDDAAASDASARGLQIDLSQTSVSGISSGAFMAVQFGVAFSSIMKGIAVFAGGPFGCSQGSVSVAETTCADDVPAPNVSQLVATTKTLATSGAIDDPANLASMRIFLFGGADDVVVSPLLVDATETYFDAFVPAASIQYVNRRPGTGHTMPTLAYGGSCDASVAPWIGNCGYDGAGTALAQIYGPLSAPSTSATGTVRTIPQASFVTNPASHSLGDTAYAYVPISCASGAICRVHVAFHGCDMEATGSVGSAFYLHAGYNEWADTNQIVVLYPQTISSAANPQACWDFWGYDSAQFDTKAGPQMAMTRAMIDALAGANAGD